MDNDYEARITELTRKGAIDKVKFMENLRVKVMPSQLEKIKQGDKSVLPELFLPKWVTWDFLQLWAAQYRTDGEGRKCVLCANKNEVGIDFDEKFICNHCFMRIKHIDQKMVE